MDYNDNVKQLINSVTKTIVEHHYFYLTDQIVAKNEINTDGLNIMLEKYIDLFIEIKAFFLNTRIGKNPFVKSKDLDKFTKTYLLTHDSFMNAVIYRFGQVIKNQLDYEKQNITEGKKFLKINTEDFDDQKLLEEKLLKLKLMRSKYDNLYLQGKEKLEIELNKYSLAYWQRLITLLEKCESSIEEAFLLGLITYIPHSPFLLNWLDNQVFDAHVRIDRYSLDFAYKLEEKNVKIGIELDEHDYPQRAKKQASKDRFFSKKGWQILHLNTRDIDNNLEECILKFKKILVSYKEMGFLEYI